MPSSPRKRSKRSRPRRASPASPKRAARFVRAHTPHATAHERYMKTAFGVLLLKKSKQGRSATGTHMDVVQDLVGRVPAKELPRFLDQHLTYAEKQFVDKAVDEFHKQYAADLLTQLKRK